jgi:hypothetical protein
MRVTRRCSALLAIARSSASWRRPSCSSVDGARRPVLSLVAGLAAVLLGGFAGETRGQAQEHAGHALG